MGLINDANNVLLGTVPVDAVYSGTVKVWPTAPETWLIEQIDLMSVRITGPSNMPFYLAINAPFLSMQYGVRFPRAGASGTTNASGEAIITTAQIGWTETPINYHAGYKLPELTAGEYVVTGQDQQQSPMVRINGMGFASYEGTRTSTMNIYNSNVVDSYDPPIWTALEMGIKRTDVRIGTIQNSAGYVTDTISSPQGMTWTASPGWSVSSLDGIFLSTHIDYTGLHINLFSSPGIPILGLPVTNETLIWDSNNDSTWAANPYTILPFNMEPDIFYSAGDRVANPPNFEAWVPEPLDGTLYNDDLYISQLCHYEFA